MRGCARSDSIYEISSWLKRDEKVMIGLFGIVAAIQHFDCVQDPPRCPNPSLRRKAGQSHLRAEVQDDAVTQAPHIAFSRCDTAKVCTLGLNLNYV